MVLNLLKNRLENKDKTLLMFDYDGTLCPIKPKPHLAKMDKDLGDKLENLAEEEFLRLAIITGRSIKDLQKVSGIKSKHITISGLHGGEILNKGEIKITSATPKEIETIQKIEAELQEKCAKMDGIFLENKGYSIALHYRLAIENIAEKAINIFFELVHKYNKSGLFKVQKGKKVVEMLPSEFQKSTIVHNLIKENPDYVPFYFGDDITDICAFEEVKKSGGYSVGITPLPFAIDNLIDAELSQKELQEFFLNTRLVL
jgi:trehalose 6-phosphate phosphatase